MPGKIWTQTKLIAAIKKLHRQGADLSATAIQKTDSALFSSARSRSHFGSWRAAIEAAGLDYDAYKRVKQCWTHKEITNQICALYGAGEDLLDPNFKIKHRSLYLAACAQRYFGSWRRAVEAAGLDHEALRESRVWTKNRILRTIEQMGNEGKPLGWAFIEQHEPGIYRAARRKENFGSWAGALRAAGFDDQVSRATLKRESNEQALMFASKEQSEIPRGDQTRRAKMGDENAPEREAISFKPKRTVF